MAAMASRLSAAKFSWPTFRQGRGLRWNALQRCPLKYEDSTETRLRSRHKCLQMGETVILLFQLEIVDAGSGLLFPEDELLAIRSCLVLEDAFKSSPATLWPPEFPTKLSAGQDGRGKL
jgi:hypothetical protein